MATRGFQPGTPKPANSGIKKGQKQSRTIARESAYQEQMDELKRLSVKLAGKDARETMEAMEYNPVAHLILMAVAENTQDGVRQKAITELVKRHSPDLKSIEISGQTEQKIEINLGGSLAHLFQHMDRRETAIDAVVSPVEPHKLEQATQLPNSLDGLSQGVKTALDDDDA